ncbi:hypothetical protein HF086_011580 [Spodoptera exigua]|uniref:ZAD domain-containing protein n=1 Tax=Spodoptera exigua TaxID=7107 RepID=A0A922MDG3_SPOEX|nr:hypothetical protein HF086_011580 [Spodoptera exigua]
MDIKEEQISYKLLCNACLCVGRKLHKITDEKTQKYYLNALDEIPLYNPSSVSLLICWECKALLEKSVAFKEQVQDSYRILQTYTHENLQDCLASDVSENRLKSTSEPTNLSSEEFETFPEVPIVCVKEKFKEEWDEKGSR